MRVAHLAPGLVAGLFVFTGCLDAQTGKPTDVLPAANPDLGFTLATSSCIEAGSVSMYNIATTRMVPEPWEPADINDDLGNPRFGSYGVPITGPTTGIWHMGVICDGYDYHGAKKSLKWGWVGVKVKPPPWDDGRIQRQFILADLSFGDEEVVKLLGTEPGFHVSKTLDGKFEWMLPNVMHSFMEDTSHGSFETWAGLKEYRALELPDTRFWFPIAQGEHTHESAAGDTKFRPHSLDLTHTSVAPNEHWVINENMRLFFHTKPAPVGPIPARQVEHYGYTGGAIAFLEFDRTITLGPAPDILLDKTWTH